MLLLVNIGPRERARRRLTGSIVFALAIGLAVWLVAADLPRGYRLFVAIPLGMAVLCFLQDLGRT